MRLNGRLASSTIIFITTSIVRNRYSYYGSFDLLTSLFGSYLPSFHEINIQFQNLLPCQFSLIECVITRAGDWSHHCQHSQSITDIESQA